MGSLTILIVILFVSSSKCQWDGIELPNIFPNSSNSTSLGCSQWRFCSQCSSTECLKCKVNTTLTLGTSNISSANNNYQTKSCLCRPPFVLNFRNQNQSQSYPIDILSQSQYVDPQRGCILCTDKFSIDECIPAAFLYNQSENERSVSFSLKLNRNYSDLSSQNFISLRTAFTFHYGIDGKSLLGLDALNLTFRVLEGQPVLLMNMTGLRENVLLYYQSKGYIRTSNYYLQIRLNESNYVFVNSSGVRVPRSYNPRMWLKSSSRNGFVSDDTYRYYPNGTQAIFVKFSFPGRSTNNTNNTNNTNYPGHGYDNESNQQSNQTHQNGQNGQNNQEDEENNENENNNQNEKKNNGSSKVIQKTENGLGIAVTFTQQQVILKQSAMGVLILGASFGILGTGAVNWLTLSLGYTQVFRSKGLYKSQNSSNNSDARLLVGYYDDLTQQQIPFDIPNYDAQAMIKVISTTILAYNPLIQFTTTTSIINISQTFPSCSSNLVFTYLSIIIALIILTLSLMYLNGYTKGKTKYDFSHIYYTLAHKDMVKRVVFLTMKGLYPLFVYAAYDFVINMYLFFFKLSNSGFPISNLWNLAYFVEGVLFTCAAIFLPILGIIIFDKNDKNNLHIYSKMYGEQENVEFENISLKSETSSQNASDRRSQKKRQKKRVIKQKKNNDEPEETGSSSSDSDELGDVKFGVSLQKAKEMKRQIRKRIAVAKNVVNGKNIFVGDYSMNHTMDKFIPLENLKVFRGSWRPILFYVYEFIYPIAFIGMSLFMSKSETVQILSLLIITGFYIVLVVYMGFTVCVSKIYAVIRAIDLILVAGFLVCRIFWEEYDIVSGIAFYLLCVIGAWAIFGITFSFLNMVYWEKKGLGVYGYFSAEVAPMVDEQQSLPTKAEEQQFRKQNGKHRKSKDKGSESSQN